MEAIYFLFLFIFIISKVRKLFWNLNKTIKNFEDSNEHIIKPLCTNIFKDHATSHLTITKTSVVNEFLCMCVCGVCAHCVLLIVTPWTAALQAPLSMGFPRQEYWVASYSFKGSSQPRSWTLVSCIGRWILYCWVTREAHVICIL